MNTRPTAIRYYSLRTASSLTGLSPRRIRGYVKREFVRPASTEGRGMQFSEDELAQLRRIRRLSDDLGLNLAGVEITLRLLKEIERLQKSAPNRERGAGPRLDR
jgi:MerR family transcriptional regulator, heat shock protein HspR